MGPVYDIPSAAAQTQPAEQQDELHYSNIIFPQNQEEALYSNVRPAQPHRHEDEDSGVEYTAVKTESASGAPGWAANSNHYMIKKYTLSHKMCEHFICPFTEQDVKKMGRIYLYSTARSRNELSMNVWSVIYSWGFMCTLII